MKVYKTPLYASTTVVEFDKSEISKIHFALCKQPRQTLKEFYDECSLKPEIICNGGLFNMNNGNTMFDYRTDGKLLCSTEKYRAGIGVTNAGELALGDSYDSRFRDFVSGYPVLLSGGNAVSINYAKELNYYTRRTVLGYNDTKIFLVAVEGRGINFPKLQQLLKSLGVKNAVNLDGGGSTKILQNGKSLTTDNYDRAVDNVICFFLKQKEEPKPIYRCQVGAFKTKANADALAYKIHALPDTIGAGYRSAYVRYINGFYKVQVSAFSKKENAEKVVSDLKAKGYNAFITTN